MDRDVKRHPIRGALWGLLFGLGLYLLLVELKVFVIGSWTPVLLALLIGVAVNVAWSTLAPPKAAKAPKGWVAAPVMAAEPVAYQPVAEPVAYEAPPEPAAYVEPTEPVPPPPPGGSDDLLPPPPPPAPPAA